MKHSLYEPVKKRYRNYNETLTKKMDAIVQTGMQLGWQKPDYELEVKALLSEIRNHYVLTYEPPKVKQADSETIYLWTDSSETFSEDLIAQYDTERSPNRYLFQEGRTLSQKECPQMLSVYFPSKKEVLLQYDCLPNTALVPLVNQRVQKILLQLAPNDIQIIPVVIECDDASVSGYGFINIIHKIVGIDSEKSQYTTMIKTPRIRSFNYLTYTVGCMKQLNLARDEEYLGNLLVSAPVFHVFQLKHISGVNLIRPELFYRPVTIDDLRENN